MFYESTPHGNLIFKSGRQRQPVDSGFLIRPWFTGYIKAWTTELLQINNIQCRGGHYGPPIGFSYAASKQFAVGR